MRALILDFDGVIVDSERHWKIKEREVLCELLPNGWTLADGQKTMGMSISDMHRFLTKEHGLHMHHKEWLSLVDRIARRVYEVCSLIDGVDKCLQSVKRQGIPLAIASSSHKDWITDTLTRFKIAHHFSAIASSELLKPGEGKPKPTIYLRAAEMIDVPPEQCIAIEDSEHGTKAAKNAGMYCVGLRNGMNDFQDLSAADRIISHFREFDILQPYTKNQKILVT
ncbi:hypothetical protein A2635_04455 [Candidatus Peribacteria bacterium RIFCSPHIGHO2_01_FULL_51_9]|nr:MAG: hypothetical protein A2635_04455 [Candidatus Peribacteria bacterium RIFCSPHIGHO2_01_FULL_51_9]